MQHSDSRRHRARGFPVCWGRAPYLLQEMVARLCHQRVHRGLELGKLVHAAGAVGTLLAPASRLAQNDGGQDLAIHSACSRCVV